MDKVWGKIYHCGKKLSMLFCCIAALHCYFAVTEAWAAEPAGSDKTHVCTYSVEELAEIGLFGAEPLLSFKERSSEVNLCAAGGAIFGAVTAASAALKLGGLPAVPVGAAVGALTGILLRVPVCYQEFMNQLTKKEEALNKCNTYCKKRYKWGMPLGGDCREVEVNDAKPAGAKKDVE